MHIKGSGGFDAEKFQKLVAMLDSPSTGEVANAFRLAIAELKKRLKFVDQTGSSAEAIKVQLECEAARLDLQKELNTAKRKGASSDELKAIIERLYRRISMLEEAASHASPSQPPEPDWAEEYMHEDPVQPGPPQQQPVQPNLCTKHLRRITLSTKTNMWIKTRPPNTMQLQRSRSILRVVPSLARLSLLASKTSSHNEKRFGWPWPPLQSLSNTSALLRTLLHGL
jgi:hypothetical protein